MTVEERARLTGTPAKPEETTIPKAFFNFTVCIVASALLTIPYGFDKTGWLGGLILLTMVGALVDYTLICLGETCIKLNIFDYQQIAEMSFGKKGRYIQAAVQLFLSLSLMVSYQIIAAGNVKGMLSETWVAEVEGGGVPLTILLVLLLTICIIIPLATLATLKMLGYSSMISVASIMILTIALLYFDIRRDPANEIQPVSSQLFTGLSVFATGFVCHQIVTPTLDSLQDDTRSKKQKFHIIVHLAIGASFLFFVSVGIMGYYLCHDKDGVKECPGNILEAVWGPPEEPTKSGIQKDPFGKIAILMFLITALFAYPLEHFSCYNTICKLLYGEYGKPQRLFALIIKLGLVFFTTIPALFIRDVGPLLSWAGNLAAFPLGFLLPLSMAVKNRNQGIPTRGWEVILRCVLLGIAAVLMAIQTFQSLADIYCGMVDGGNSTQLDETADYDDPAEGVVNLF